MPQVPVLLAATWALEGLAAQDGRRVRRVAERESKGWIVNEDEDSVEH